MSAVTVCVAAVVSANPLPGTALMVVSASSNCSERAKSQREDGDQRDDHQRADEQLGVAHDLTR